MYVVLKSRSFHFIHFFLLVNNALVKCNMWDKKHLFQEYKVSERKQERERE